MSAVIDVLNKAKRHGQVYFRANEGNAGDSLLNFGFYSLAKKIGLFYEEIYDGFDYGAISENSVLILSGGGNIVPYWEGGSNLLRKIAKYNFPLIMLPQSIEGRPEVLRLLRKKDVLILREKFSYEYAVSLGLECKLYIDHDLAFFVDLDFLYEFKRVFPPQFNLTNVQKMLKVYYQIIRSVFYRELKALRTDHESILGIGAKKINDISRIAKFGTKGIFENAYSSISLLNIVSRYKLVETDRLHVFIACMLAGTKVRLRDNKYYKIKGVYEYSVKTSEPYSHLVDYAQANHIG